MQRDVLPKRVAFAGCAVGSARATTRRRLLPTRACEALVDVPDEIKPGGGLRSGCAAAAGYALSRQFRDGTRRIARCFLVRVRASACRFCTLTLSTPAKPVVSIEQITRC